MDDKPKKPKGTVGGGRAPGQRNILPPLGKSARQTLINLLGFDDETVARTGMINGKGVHARQRLFETIHGLRPATPKEFMDALRFVWDRGIGTPAKMTSDVVQRDPVIFIGPPPWDPNTPINRALNARSARMIAEGDAQRALEAADRKAEAAEVIIEAKAKGDTDAAGLEAAEGFEAVNIPPLPQEFHPPGRERDRGR